MRKEMVETAKICGSSHRSKLAENWMPAEEDCLWEQLERKTKRASSA